MLSFTNLALRRGTELLFEHVTFTVHSGKKVGLIGANGAGKTSLFKLITGGLEADQGNLEFPTRLRIAYMAQEVPANETAAVNYVEGGDEVLAEVLELIKGVEEREDYGKLADLHVL